MSRRSTSHRPVPLRLTRAHAIEGVALVLLFALGGGSSHVPLTRLGAQLIGLGLMAGPLVHARWSAVYRADRLLVWLGLALAMLFAAQLVPLSAGLWDSMPGHAPFAAGDRLMFGHPVARPLSLDPDETVASALFLIPALALWLRARTNRGFATRAIVAFLCFLGCSLLLAIVQAGSAPGDFHLYNNAHSPLPTGLFANRNHQAIAMDCGIVLAAMLQRSGVLPDDRKTAWRWLFAVVTPLCVVGALLTGSRAGAALLLPALIIGCLLAGVRIRGGRIGLAIVLGLVALVVLVVLGVMFSPGGQLAAIFSRSYVAEDDRYRFWPAVVAMIRAYAPWGSGFGSFPYTYEVTEPNDLLSALWLNHAHNDWLEYLVEAGVPGALLALGFLLWLGLRLWPSRAPLQAVTLGAGAIIVLLLLHSGYDYPLRTVAISALGGVMLAVMAPRPPLAAISQYSAPAPSAVRRLIVAGGTGVVALAMIMQCLGFSAALSNRPQFGTIMPLASARASTRTALQMALVHAPAKAVARMAAQAGMHGPLDGPAFTALALTETDPARANALFAQAHRLSRHDADLLSALFTRARTDHDPAAELAAFDELARQQIDVPQQDGELARDMADPQLQRSVVGALEQGVPWRGRFVETASRDPAALRPLAMMALGLQRSAAPLRRDELVPLISALLLQGAADDQDYAWQLWRSLAPAADPLAWDPAASARIALPFDWTLEGHTAPGDRGTIRYDNSDGSAPIAASKTIFLANPAYRFVASGDVQGVALRLDCNGQVSQTPAGGKVVVPAGCKLARISIMVPNRGGTLGPVRLVNDSR